MIGELVTLEILSIRDCQLEELPVEIGKLTNLIMLELGNRVNTLERISAGVLSRLIRLEKLHIVGVKWSYSTLRELESLSRLTALTLKDLSGDVISYNLYIPSKLARYTLQVGGAFIGFYHQGSGILYPRLENQGTPNMNDYDKKIALHVHDTAPLGDSIRSLLKESEAVHSIGKGSNNVLGELQVNELQNLKYLCLEECDLVTHLLKRTRQVIKFPNLYDLELGSLKCFTHFCSNNVEGIEFPRLRIMRLEKLPEFQNFWPTVNNSNPLFHQKVSCPNLEVLCIEGLPCISALWSHQAGFIKLEILQVVNCGKLINLMSPSVGRGLLNLILLCINACESMKEVITDEEQQEEAIIPLFPKLEELMLYGLPKLRHFFLSVSTLEIPSLRKVRIDGCPEMKTFVQERISDDDLNKTIFDQFFCPNWEELNVRGLQSISALWSHKLPTAYFTKLVTLKVDNCEKLRNLMSPSMARELLNIRSLSIQWCESMEEVITEEEQQGEGIITLFPMLEELMLWSLPKLRHFFLSVHTLEIPSLGNLVIEYCPKMKTFVQEEMSEDNLNKAMFDSKIFCPNLKLLHIYKANSMSILCSHQLPTAYFSKLVQLYVFNCGKLRNLMFPSVARGLLNLKVLYIEECESMEEVITKGEVIMTLFPMLEELRLQMLPKLRHFFLTEHALKFPLLYEVEIKDCPEMKTFFQQGISVSTPSLKWVNYDDRVKVDDLNKWTQERFTSKEQQDSQQSTTDGYESEANDGNESEVLMTR